MGVERILVPIRYKPMKMNTRPTIANDMAFYDTTGRGRIEMLRQYVTALFRYERMELTMNRAIETQGYVERLIQEAVKNGDLHKPTMQLMDFWMLEKDLIHKVFKVFVPRYREFTPPYTKTHTLPWNMEMEGPSGMKKPGGVRGLLELKGNPYPPIAQKALEKKNSLVNILLAEAKKEYYLKNAKAEEEQAQLESEDQPKKPREFSPYVTYPFVHNPRQINNKEWFPREKF